MSFDCQLKMEGIMIHGLILNACLEIWQRKSTIDGSVGVRYYIFGVPLCSKKVCLTVGLFFVFLMILSQQCQTSRVFIFTTCANVSSQTNSKERVTPATPTNTPATLGSFRETRTTTRTRRSSSCEKQSLRSSVPVRETRTRLDVFFYKAIMSSKWRRRTGRIFFPPLVVGWCRFSFFVLQRCRLGQTDLRATSNLGLMIRHGPKGLRTCMRVRSNDVRSPR